MRKILSNPLVYVTVLTAIVFVCFGRTLGSYFLADDFGEVAYVAKIFEGDWQRLWSNFTGNYMQVPSMAVYRPWLLMTLLFDYAIFRTNAAGYYFTNLMHYLACTILVFSLIKLLTPYWGKLRSNLAATFSALLFAVHPLHCESVSWVVGRVDIVCLTYYLSGLVSTALYVRTLNKKWLLLTFASFWVGILTKEMAIALPVTATALAFLWSDARKFGKIGQEESAKKTIASKPSSNDLNFDPSSLTGGSTAAPQNFSHEPSRASAIAALQRLDQELEPHASPLPSPAEGDLVMANEIAVQPINPTRFDQQTMRDRIQVVIPVAAMLFASTVVYFIIRYAALGTITGGYTGSIGSSQFSGILQKWTDLDTVLRIIFPLNQFVFADGTAQKNLLAGIYLTLIALLTTRLIIGSLPRRWLVFIAIASVTALAPIYQLWGIGYELEGSRFVFFLTVSLAMMFPVILFSPLQRVVPPAAPSPITAAIKASSTTGAAEAAGAVDAENAANKRTSPPRPPTVSNFAGKAERRLLVLSIVALTGLTLVFARLTLRNNIPWVHAGKQTEAIHDKAIALSKATAEGKLVGVIGIPKDEGGAHMILNGTTFRQLITPPFAQSGLTGKILTFEPSLFGDAEKIDTHHFKEALSKPNLSAFLVWNMDKKDFVRFDPGAPPAVPQAISIPLLGVTKNNGEAISGPKNIDDVTGAETINSANAGSASQPIASFPYTQGRGDVSASGQIENAERGLGIRISGLNLRPAQFDYIAIRATAPSGTPLYANGSLFGAETCKVGLESATGEKSVMNVRLSAQTTKTADNKLTLEARLPLSAYWKFYSVGEIANIVIDLPSVKSLQIDDVKLMPAALVAPSVTVVERASADDGAYNVDKRRRKPENKSNDAPVRIAVDASKLAGTARIEAQILYKNFFFDNLKSDAALKSGTQETLGAEGDKTTFVVPDKIVDSSGFIQLRVRALNNANQQIGEYSFPITLRVIANQLK
ncbi:MAG: hypothetical protein SGJ27_11145 [Candidatus Melainabacteria bacterium]|nr:hypothetical protein [Candidatus Melainabacteria bacterium]